MLFVEKKIFFFFNSYTDQLIRITIITTDHIYYLKNNQFYIIN